MKQQEHAKVETADYEERTREKHPAKKLTGGLLTLSPLEGRKSYNVWDDYLLKLIKFQRENGHCNPPADHPSGLSPWVIRQRYQYKLFQQGKHSNMTYERSRILDDIGLVWDLNKARWLEKYDQLMNFKRQYGHCDVPVTIKELGKWVAYQRYQFRLLTRGKHSALTQTRKDKLDEAGFRWKILGKTVDKEIKDCNRREKGQGLPNIAVATEQKIQPRIEEQHEQLEEQMQKSDTKRSSLRSKQEDAKKNVHLLINDNEKILLKRKGLAKKKKSTKHDLLARIPKNQEERGDKKQGELQLKYHTNFSMNNKSSIKPDVLTSHEDCVSTLQEQQRTSTKTSAYPTAQEVMGKKVLEELILNQNANRLIHNESLLMNQDLLMCPNNSLLAHQQKQRTAIELFDYAKAEEERAMKILQQSANLLVNYRNPAMTHGLILSPNDILSSQQQLHQTTIEPNTLEN